MMGISSTPRSAAVGECRRGGRPRSVKTKQLLDKGRSLSGGEVRSYGSGPVGPGLSHKSGPVFVGEGQRPALEEPGWLRKPTANTSPVIATEPTGFRGPAHEANGLFFLKNRGRLNGRGPAP